MVVNESALLRAMREDYKGQGYTVARRADDEDDPESESSLLLSANDWMVEIGWKNVSAKIFGLVAEHMKGLPEVGQAFKVKKGRPFSPSRHFEMPAYPRRDRRLLGSEEKTDGDDQRRPPANGQKQS